jgi:uncharacterized short protein YbdD (DUF466 family)
MEYRQEVMNIICKHIKEQVASQASLHLGVRVIRVDAISINPLTGVSEYDVWVEEMPSFPDIEGAKAAFRWIEGNLDFKTVEVINQWRENQQQEAGIVWENKQMPEPHMTIIFGHCPVDVQGKDQLLKMMLDMKEYEFHFSHIKALPPGKENCWVAVTDDPKCIEILTYANNSATLNTNHPSYVMKGSWPVSGGAFDTIIPHVTLVRGLNEKDGVCNPPLISELLKNHGAKLVSVSEVVGMIIGDMKIKFKKNYQI